MSWVQPYILLVEDDEALAELLRYNLAKEGYRVHFCLDGPDALINIGGGPPDLVILDWTLPTMAGIEVCQSLRQNAATHDLPILMLTARRAEGDRVRGLDAGADDFVVKPFLMSELAARIRAVLRRAGRGPDQDSTRLGDIVIDRAAHRVKRGGLDVRLGPTQFRLLDYFMQHPGHVISREQLISVVWGQNVHVETGTIDVHVGRLRRALMSHGEASPIRTVHMAGYALEV